MSRVISRSFNIYAMLYFVLYKILRYRYAVVLQNLSRSFPERSYADISQVAAGFYRHFCRIFLEMGMMFFVSERKMKNRVRVKNPELLEQFHAKGQNIIIMLGHYGNWESLNILPRYFNFNLYAVYKPLSNAFFNRVMQRLRSRFGLRLLPMHKVGRHMLTKKAQAGAYILVSDQFPPNEAHTVRFLHQPTRVITGAERLAKTTGATVVYASVKKTAGPADWEISFRLICDAPAVSLPYEITHKFTEYLEEDIRENPQYWLWTHRRWKQQ
ncbi:lipid A biosynthesis acyltransferase [Chitinophaga lutea]|uniref:Lipid A biosynthesis acyltransferase n=2 Tax=Chitinophaga lutea TaxID=2488634 RepID=A0A3N4PER4_9BACT|nr:lipid A biosynthesis acyltransferase [Chitinophaga lutea]